MVKFRNDRPPQPIDGSLLADDLRERGHALLALADRIDPELEKHEFRDGSAGCEGECTTCGSGSDAPQHLDVNGDPIGGS